ncbi:hypothetical protein OSB04_015708 [Centaurea solstitialis]|uniref:Uncharacterized protein n=1 Tax=Centaurea solstitialis TaxID=347529 RepID=A0AA38TJJ5_9ASTR|nr:hypothetical protein OSB04_015708 [Centaurea solstitialis]
MAYIAGLQMFMGYLKQIINCNDIPFINNNPMILSERPQFQLLYQELASIIQTLSNIDQHLHHELEKVRNLKKRFKDVVEEAQDIIDLYLSAVTVDFGDIGLSPTSDVFKTSLDLENVMKSIESLKLEVTTINIDIMKMDPSPRINSLKTHSGRDAAGTSTSNTRSSLGKLNPSMEEIVVGLDRDAEIIRDKLTEDTKQLCIVSIVGMGGLGKTTLATKLFNDPFIKYHFHIRAWATVSQTYIRRDLLIQILVSIGVQQGLDQASDSQLRERLHKKLMGRKYLIVIDDIWSIEAWDDLKIFFPHDNTASRILLTSRQNEVALHVKPYGFVHSLPCLTDEESWELLKKKVFHGDECPEWFIKPGRHIARKCHGLPLSVVVMAGVLAQEPTNQDLWEEVACSVSSYIVGDQKGCLKTLALSYYHLPNHLRECFLYLGGFPEDFRINVKRVIRLWMAEGFVEEAGNQSLEDTAKAYLMDLINRNLVIVERRNEIGDVKACKLHDLVRELCGQKAKEEGFFLKIDSTTSSSQLPEGIGYEQRRIFTNQSVNILNMPHSLTRTVRTLWYFDVNQHTLESIPRCFVLLRVLDLQNCLEHDFPQGFSSLVHLRYLAIWCSGEFPKSICKLWSLQTLILKTYYFEHIEVPCNITDLVNLRHLWSNSLLHLPYIEKPMNLHSISLVTFKGGVDNFQKCFPNIRKLVFCDPVDVHNYSKHLELLPYLENLKLTGLAAMLPLCPIAFPATLKKLSLIGCELPWSDMSIIQLLPNLEVLKLQNSFRRAGGRWDACEQQFRQLKLLKLKYLNIIQWAASSTSFPCLKQLSVSSCRDLEEIPLEIGEIATLELIKIDWCSNSVVESVERIQEEQHDVGNYELKITVDGKELSLSFSQHGTLRLCVPDELQVGQVQLSGFGRARVRELQVGRAGVLSGLARPRGKAWALHSGEPEFEPWGMYSEGEAQDTIDLYLSAVTVDFSDSGLSPTSHVFNTCLDLENVMKSIDSIRVEVTTINIDIMKMDPSPRINSLKTHSARDAAGTSLDQASDFQLREKLHQKLMGRKYLIVVDDIWSIEAWDDLKLFFPHDNTASRILLTSRQNEVALHVKPHGFVHFLPCLTKEESWELLKWKVFHGDECPEWLIKPGRKIAEKCHGLPLSVVVMGGVLAKESTNKDLWEEIACNISSYQKGSLETLALSYHHLPDHLRECFLYLGGFPEDFRFNVKRLIRLWVAEGFIEEAGNQSLEDTAKAYLIYLINRNLVIVAKRNAVGAVIDCKLHDLVRELCVQKAKEEGLFLKIDSPISSSQLLEGITYEQRRIFTNQDINIFNIPYSPTPTIRTLLCFNVEVDLLKSIARSFVLLRVLYLQDCELDCFPEGLALLVHLRVRRWNACEEQFQKLKLLKFKWSEIEQWEASRTSFPSLKRLSVSGCGRLEEIPPEIGEITTLELIEIDSSSKSVVESVKRIQQEQHDEGNDELKITVDGKELSFYSSQHGSSESE